MKHTKSLIIIIGLYMAVQVLGLYVGSSLMPMIESEIIPPVVENPESPETSGQIFIYIIIMTGILLLFLKFKLDFFIRGLLFFSILMGASITFWVLFGYYGVLFAMCLVLLSNWKRDNIWIGNLTLVFTISGIGGWLGASLHVIPALLLLIGLAIYDIIAVFGTKHMVTLAKGAEGKVPLMLMIPVKDKTLGLGTGDLVMPLVFTVSVLHDYNLTIAVITGLGGLLGLLTLFYYILNKKDITLPALPPIVGGLIIGFGIGLATMWI